MNKIRLNDVEYDIKNEWGEISIDEYSKIIELYNSIDNIVEEQFLVEFILVISNIPKNVLENLYDDQIIELSQIIQNFNMNKFEKKFQSHFEIDGKIYSWNKVNKMTLGEKISLKLLQKNQSESETILNLLSVLVRPSKIVKNEFGEDNYIVDEFEGDVEVIKKRKEILKGIPAINALFILESFIPGRE
jgi:hypothetical protein